MNFFTVGVYNSSEAEFFNKLKQNGIDTFCDIRQRRGVRGSKYSFVNSNRLQEKLAEIGIKYSYVKDLAPSTEIRELQKKVDSANGQLKSERQVLGQTFVVEYKNKILRPFDFKRFIDELEKMGATRVALFCVEQSAEACHRSIVADQLQQTYNYTIEHL